MITIIIPPSLDQYRADIALSQMTDFSRNHIQKLIKEGCIFVNSLPVPNRSFRVSTDEIYTIKPDLYRQIHAYSEKEQVGSRQFSILFEDEQIVVINKEEGVVVHSGAGNKENTLAHQLYAYYGGRLSTLSSRPGIVHRLDKGTSGIMLIAKTDQAHRDLQAQFEQRIVQKTYLARVDSIDRLPQHFKLECKIGPHDRQKHLMKAYHQKMTILEDEQIELNPSPSDRADLFTSHCPEYNQITSYKHAILECWQVKGLLVCKPYTGRQHQIRAQLKAMGCPIAGDLHYGGSICSRMFLHAFGVSFNHKGQGKSLFTELPTHFFPEIAE